MPKWYANRLHITGQPDQLDALRQWGLGDRIPYYGQAIHQSIKLFVAGCVGLLQPTETTDFLLYPALVAKGTGGDSPENRAFEQWLALLKENVALDEVTSQQIDRLYQQSGLAERKWETLLPTAQKTIMALFNQKSCDWFGLVDWNGERDTEMLWSHLDDRLTETVPCDLFLLIPTHLASEINGFCGGLLRDHETTHELYIRLYGMAQPRGYDIAWKHNDDGSLTGHFDKTPREPWYEKIIAPLSRQYHCHITHYFKGARSFCGYDTYRNGQREEVSIDELEFGEEDGVRKVIGPAYILGNISHDGC
ncbi:DUF1281 domain-containing protein [Photorhabdus laumondii subsp. laumondii]|uniref:Photorhabdus luminescens subsp. laumondii TTO1 complete genome segment 4/17 n=4 Tax=Photorhabdus TaxID=29487 RepID=Q7N7I7_PHOLL|nr:MULTISPECIES: DUF1281 domain-containing protein [Photorhabdus]AWK41053.1 hypothetical protein A4R40_05740 [Photorhabdus laumondii subsp. laumondii]AXG41794.1 DUF1281 domain-containing protein [Photorhabdus laumondii subsp. laumondii]AXG46382.1 DUF1281 domain-containing protein [Photorhabdus laumondii subsp. laumondii]KTL62442.1 hypothetical protein AA106_20480 [Photorhabdus laumondii subsp. laumondii]MCC8384905.1 DUF1281 domain-containing protein [Photorhabdus laumondii]